MNSDIADISEWARSNGFEVRDDANAYTRFYTPTGDFVVRYPATPSNPRRRMLDLIVALRKAGFHLPPPSKKQRRAERTRKEK